MDHEPSRQAAVNATGGRENVSRLDHNPHLKPWQMPTPNNVAGKGRIESPGDTPNLVWQTRAAPPSDYENTLGDALEVLFERGAETAEQVAAGLNEMGLRTPDSQAWTVARLESEMARLGA